MNISLTQVGGSSADLIGAAITITDDDSGDTLFTAIWNGSTITTEIPMGTYYTVSFEIISGYLPLSGKKYLAGYQTERNLMIQYKTLGVFIEDTNGVLYTSSNWSSEKTANSVVVLTNICKIRLALTEKDASIHSNATDPLENYIAGKDEANGKLDYDGEGNTNKIIQFNTAYGTNTDSYAAPYCKAYTFSYPIGKKGYFAAWGQLNVIYQNKTSINACMIACGGQELAEGWRFASTYNMIQWGTSRCNHLIQLTNGGWSSNQISMKFPVRPIADYEI